MKIQLSLFFLLFFAISCSKDTVVFTTPSTYNYSHSKVASEKIFEVKGSVFTEINQHPFDELLELLHDSTEVIMENVYETSQIISMLFLDDKMVKVKGHEENRPYEIEGKYELSGNKILFDSLDIFISLSDDFSEMYHCAEVAIVKGTTDKGFTFTNSIISLCSSTDHKTSAENIVATYNTWTVEHIAIAYLDLIYKK